ncbi:hypothetical protein SAMN05444920_108407 [Nonomuraea solani]|uniref:DUF7824 domain-containing protein n=1 Tax=Nonomuraea solani TaxID=1144553 RepID=A0A1H6EBB2_9ACTN|nr:DUF6493 family protein [Nonomuraea solani]SEG94553.1 hypothetical protein SAMN05444920_108407 [Nonomuraea solani]
MNAWAHLLPLIEAGHTTGVHDLVAGLDEPGRQAVAAELPGYLRGLTPWWTHQDRFAPLLVAGAGCMSGPAAVTAWLFRRDFTRAPAPDEVLALLRRRPKEWRQDAARRIAARVRPPGLEHWEVAAALVRESGIEPPGDDGFKVGWLRALGPLTAARDPLFEIDGLGEVIEWQVGTIIKLVENGLLDRTTVIDGAIGRLLRDGPAGLTALATLHDRLDPDLDETAAHAKDYVSLIPSAPGAVAALALARLRLLDGAGRLDDASFVEALEALSFRREKKLLGAAISWAGESVRPERVDGVLRAMSALLTQDALTLQTRAVRLAVKLAPRAGEPAREAIRQSATGLPAELREQITTAYGHVPTDETTTAPALTAPPPPEMPPPITSPADLARDLSALLRGHDAHGFERVLAGLAEWSHREPETLREALRPGVKVSDAQWAPYTALQRAFAAFFSPARSRQRRRLVVDDTFDHLYEHRAIELATAFEEGTTYPLLLATPTRGTGHVDPTVLLDRFDRLEAAGLEALPADLTQALLRLPREIDDQTLARADKLTSEAGRTCATWMRDGGLPDFHVTNERRPRKGVGGFPWRDLGLDVTLPEPFHTLFTSEPGRPFLLWTSLVTPSHRELLAFHLACQLPYVMESSSTGYELLPELAHADGPIGHGMAWALAFCMSHITPGGRAAATDTLLILTARDQVPIAELAEALATLTEAGYVKLNRAASVLTEAAQAGAHETVWELITWLLPGLLPADGDRPRAGLADLLATATTAATLTRARADLPDVAAIAARGGSSRLVQESRRLLRQVRPEA